MTKRRTKEDWAKVIRNLVNVHYPGKRVVLVMDNLNTYSLESFYRAFSPKEARRIIERLETHYTPKHGNWINLAEIGIGVLRRQCLDRLSRTGRACAGRATLGSSDATKMKTRWTGVSPGGCKNQTQITVPINPELMLY